MEPVLQHLLSKTPACRKALAKLRHHRKLAPTLHCQSSTLLLSPSQCSKTHHLGDQPMDSINNEMNISVNTSGGHLWCSYTRLSQAKSLKMRKVLREFTKVLSWSLSQQCQLPGSVEKSPKKSNHLKVQAVLDVRG